MLRRIQQILSVEKRLKGEKVYYITSALLDFPEDDPRHGEVFEGYGNDFKLGDKIECWFDDRWGKAKFQK